MTLDPRYRAVTLRKEGPEGRSFSPDEFAIAMEKLLRAAGLAEAPARAAAG